LYYGLVSNIPKKARHSFDSIGRWGTPCSP